MDTLELLLHPIRLRIAYALSGGRVRTTAELCAALSDVPRTTLYRHVALLAEHGLLEVAEEQKVRGVIERHYRLRRERAVITRRDAEEMSLDDHRRTFAAAMAALHAEFNAYISRPDAEPVPDSVAYRQDTWWLSQDEMAELRTEVSQAFAKHLDNTPGPGRRPYLFSTIIFPTEPPAPDASDQP